MFNQLVEMLNAMAEIDIAKTPNLRVIIMLRDGLVGLGTIDQSTANKLVMRMKINIIGEYTDDDLHLLVDPLALAISNMAKIFYANRFSVEDFVLMGNDFSLTLEE